MRTSLKLERPECPKCRSTTLVCLTHVARTDTIQMYRCADCDHVWSVTSPIEDGDDPPDAPLPRK